MFIKKYLIVLLVFIIWTNLKAQPAGVDISMVSDGFIQAVGVTSANDGSGRLFVTEQNGVIKTVENGILLPTPFLDISTLVMAGGERGLLGLAFHPNHNNNGHFFVFFSNTNGDNQLVRFTVSAQDNNSADPNSAYNILTVTGTVGFHNGGDLHFGPDNYLYLSTGDGGYSILDAQSNDSFLGKILRINIDADDFPSDSDNNYAVPNDNPYSNAVWAKGFRNPWRFSFDRLNGDLFIGDVGEDGWEEFNYMASGNGGGQNFGWPCFENNDVFINNDTCQAITNHQLPIIALEHNLPGTNYCSAIGGFRYRGNHYPGSYGWYFYTDWCDGNFWSAIPDQNGAWTSHNLGNFLIGSVRGMGEGDNGELYIMTADSLYQLVGEPLPDVIFVNGFESTIE